MTTATAKNVNAAPQEELEAISEARFATTRGRTIELLQEVLGRYIPRSLWYRKKA
jgi:hypothetical protein